MLTAEQNDELTEIAPGTPVGELLRRYWYPICFTRELEEFPVKHAKLLGEDWAVYKTASGQYGVVPEACPHRRASLAYGVVEANGIRCPYHGWLFGLDGECLEQPAERDETNFQDRVRVKAGKAQELGGLVWVYVGPDPAPELPRFDVFVMDGVRDIGWADIPCNYVQIMENAVDPHHVEFLHGRYFEFMGRQQGFEAPASFAKKHIKVGFDAFEWGIIKRRVRRGRDRGGRRLGRRPPAGVPVQHAGRRREHRADADPGADRPLHDPLHALLRARAGRHRATPSRSASRTTRSRCSTRTVGTAPTTSRARTSWPG